MATTAAPTTTTPPVPAPRVVSRPATLLQMVVVAVILGAVGWLAVQMFVLDGTVTSQSGVVERVDESTELQRLVRTGQIPAAAYDAESEATRRLTAQGLIPSAPTSAATAGAAPVDDDAETARLVTRGLIPGAVLEPTAEQAATQSLIDKGLIPTGSQR